MDLTSSDFADVENGLPKFCTHSIHGFEGEVVNIFSPISSQRFSFGFHSANRAAGTEARCYRACSQAAR